MKKVTDVKENISIDEIRNKLFPMFRDEGLRLVLLFGSTATGNVHKKSDIDLAFLFDKPVDILALTNKIIRLLHTDNVDVVDLRRASPLLKYSAVKGGKPIYEKEPGIFNEFYSLAFRMYADTKKLRDAQAASIKHFLKSRDL
ncbi:MAG: nucleotidyltransferase domain-containing protein [Candidatus Brocadiales bacterium]|nr:nucleotidyltransferase domain-containing protein [Candidatus Brocadiales bacterium]